MEPYVFPAGGRQIAPIGNAAVWIAFLGLLPFLFRSVRRDLGARLALGGYAVMYLPWLVFSRTQFVSYMTPAVLFMCLGLPAPRMWLSSIDRMFGL